MKEVKGGRGRLRLRSEEKGVKMLNCSEKGCGYFSKNAAHVKHRKANIHDIDVVY